MISFYVSFYFITESKEKAHLHCKRVGVKINSLLFLCACISRIFLVRQLQQASAGDLMASSRSSPPPPHLVSCPGSRRTLRNRGRKRLHKDWTQGRCMNTGLCSPILSLGNGKRNWKVNQMKTLEEKSGDKNVFFSDKTIKFKPCGDTGGKVRDLWSYLDSISSWLHFTAIQLTPVQRLCHFWRCRYHGQNTAWATCMNECVCECVSVLLLVAAQSEWLHFPACFSAPWLQGSDVGHQHRDNHRHERAIGQAGDHHEQQEDYEGGRCSADATDPANTSTTALLPLKHGRPMMTAAIGRIGMFTWRRMDIRRAARSIDIL